MALRANLVNKTLDVFFAVIGNAIPVSLSAQVGKDGARTFRAVAAKGFTEEFAGGAAFRFGSALHLFGEIRGKADRECA